MTFSMVERKKSSMQAVLLLLLAAVLFLCGAGLIVHAKQETEIRFALLGALLWGSAVFSGIWAFIFWVSREHQS